MENIESLKNSGEPSGSKQPASLDDISRAASATLTPTQTKDQFETYDCAGNSPTPSRKYRDKFVNSDKKSKMDPKAQTSYVKIYRPYDIEEPDDDAGPSVQGLEIPSLPDYFERWQRDLVEDIEGTQSDPSEYAARQLHTDLKRGQKRKPTSSAGREYSHASQWRCSRSGTRPRDEAASSQCRPAQKRRRRRSRLGNDSLKAAPVQSLYDFRDTQLNESSSSDNWSMETDGSADSMQDSAITDAMDID